MRTFLLALLAALPLLAQNAALPPVIHAPFLDNNGKPLAGGKLYFCSAGSTCPGNPLATYTDSTGGVQAPNPVILDSTGYAGIWLGVGPYKVAAQTSAGVSMWTVDNVQNNGLTLSGSINAIKCVASGLACLDSSAFIPQVNLNYVQGGTGSVNRTIQSRLAETMSVKDFGATGNCSTDDTTNINKAIAAAKSANASLYFPAANCYLISLTLDVTNLHVYGAGKYQSIVRMTSGVQKDVFQTQGSTTIRNLQVYGSWDGSTAGLTGNGITTLSSPGAGTPYYGYNNTFSDIRIVNVDHECIYINDGGYESLHNVTCNAAGLHGLYLDSGNYAGFQTTSTVVDGLSTFSDTPNGYGIVINNGIDIRITGATIENTRGINILGSAGRSITIENNYQEGNAGQFITAAGSGGIGLRVLNNYGPGTTGIPYSDISTWLAYEFSGNVFKTPGFQQSAWTATGSVNIDPSDLLRNDFTFSNSAETAISTAPLTAGTHWKALFIGSWLNFAVMNQPAAIIEASDANPTIAVGTDIITLSLTAGGVLQGEITTLGSGSTGVEFIGSVYVLSAKNVANAGTVALTSKDSIDVGSVSVAGTPGVNANIACGAGTHLNGIVVVGGVVTAMGGCN